ncbi:conserved membrane hypothetical protein [Novosphingobium sp. 9U]|nr:conserved membrane hypothetical protein [Novosphingobium sp. 9U]
MTETARTRLLLLFTQAQMRWQSAGGDHTNMTTVRGQRPKWRSIVLRSIALLGAPLLLYVLGKLLIEYLPRLTPAPCALTDEVTTTAHGILVVLLIAGFWLQRRAWRDASASYSIAAMLIPLLAWLVLDWTGDREADRERQCVTRPLTEAVKVCGANPAHYRLGKSRYGTDTLTLTAPGTTDQAWSCLGRWSEHNGSLSIEVDESVYREYRRTRSKTDKAN